MHSPSECAANPSTKKRSGSGRDAIRCPPQDTDGIGKGGERTKQTPAEHRNGEPSAPDESECSLQRARQNGYSERPPDPPNQNGTMYVSRGINSREAAGKNSEPGNSSERDA